MMGTQAAPERLFYDFCLEDHVPDDHLLRRIDRVLDLSEVRQKLKSFYCSIGRPSIDPELMIRMLIVGYCLAIRLQLRPGAQHLCVPGRQELNDDGTRPLRQHIALPSQHTRLWPLSTQAKLLPEHAVTQDPARYQ